MYFTLYFGAVLRTPKTPVYGLAPNTGISHCCCRCNASNIAGVDVAYTYLHVFSPEVDSLADMSGLVYPMIPLPLTTTVATTTSTVDDNTTPEPEMNSTTSTRPTEPPRTETLRHEVQPDMTSSAARDLNWRMSREADEDMIVVVIVACVSGTCLVVLLILILVVLVVRHQRRSGKYDPSRPHSVDEGCRRHWTLCCPASAGQRSVEDQEFDTSTARLKLNTSALSASATSTADRSYVSDRPSTNGVTTHTDPVEQTLIGPPLTSDAQSR